MREGKDNAAGVGELGRRQFLAAGLAAGLGPMVGRIGAVEASRDDEKPASNTHVPTRSFGKTGRELPILGYGGAALPSAWLNPLSREDRVRLVRYAYDRGLRYFDTANNYLESQAILGEGLKDIRKDVFLVTKVETTDPDKVRGAVEHALKELQTDNLDAVLIHGTPGLQQMTVAGAMKVHAELAKLRDEKVVKFLGFSAHGYFEKALALIATGGFDQCMLSYGYVPRGYDQVHSSRMVALRDACVAQAHELGMGIVAMKVIAAGMLGAWSGYIVPGYEAKRLARLPAAAIRYVLQDDRIHILNIGMRLKREIDANIAILTSDTAYTLEDRALLAEFSAKLYDSDAMKKLRVE